MIRLAKMNGQEVWINAELLESVEATPDTIVGLTNGRRIIVRETPEEVVWRAMEYQRKVRQPMWLGPRKCLQAEGGCT
jgi:flagellar protein FlbD